MTRRLLPLFLLTMLLLAACAGAADAPAAQEQPAAQEEPAVENDAAAETEPVTDEAQDEAATDEAPVDPALLSDVVATYAELVYAGYEDAYNLTADMDAAIDAFVAEPSEETLAAAKDAWLAAREVYGQTEAFRFYGGPIDDEDGPEGLINAWPLDEAYIDYVDGDAETGIINNLAEYPTIDRDLLISLNEVGAEENISTGYHAIEFLLWGQDLSADTNGQRPYTDFVVDGTAANQERRALYLATASDLLLEHLDDLVAAWRPDASDNYRAEFVAQAPEEALQKVLTGIGVLSKSELAGERMFTAYDNQDQEDEHSCFSDNTHRDTATNAQGIVNVFTGRYVRPDGSVVEGPALEDIVAQLDPELSEEVNALVAGAIQQVEAIPAPFDQAIVNADTRPLVLDAVYALQDQGDKFAEVAALLGITIDTALPE